MRIHLYMPLHCEFLAHTVFFLFQNRFQFVMGFNPFNDAVMVYVSITKWDGNRDESKKKMINKKNDIQKMTKKKSIKDPNLLFKKRLAFCLLKYFNILEILWRVQPATAASALLYCCYSVLLPISRRFIVVVWSNGFILVLLVWNAFKCITKTDWRKTEDKGE